jgi:hypothetical protein
MATSLRIAVNARGLERNAPPLPRLAAANFVHQLAEQEGVRVDLIATESIAEGIAESPARVLPRARGPLQAALFDQVRFPAMGKDLGADLLLYLHPSAPIVAPVQAVCWFDDAHATVSHRGRLDRSLGDSGLRGAAAVLRPFDVLPGPAGLPWIDVPPSVPPAFFAETAGEVPAGGSNLPEAYVLAFDESTSARALLLAAWSWVESSLGDTYLLLFVAHDEGERKSVLDAANQMGLGETVRAVVQPEQDWPAAFRQAAVFMHGGEPGNAPALRWALAGEIPVAALATAVTETIVGPAGYLVSPAEARALGAACLTLLVEEGVADALREKGRQRAAGYHPRVAGPAWAEALRHAAEGQATAPVRRSAPARRR